MVDVRMSDDDNGILRYAAGALRRAANPLIDAHGIKFDPEAAPPRQDPYKVVKNNPSYDDLEKRASFADSMAMGIQIEMVHGSGNTFNQLKKLEKIAPIDITELIAAVRFEAEAMERDIETYKAIAADARRELAEQEAAKVDMRPEALAERIKELEKRLDKK